MDKTLEELVNILIDCSEGLRDLLEADFNCLEPWDNEIIKFLDSLDELEGASDWQCLQEKG